MAELSGLGLPAGSCWVLARLARRGQVAGAGLAREAGVTGAKGHPCVDALVTAGYCERDGDMLRLTTAGGAARLTGSAPLAATGWNNCFSDWSPEQHADLVAMLDRLSHALVGEPADSHLMAR